MNSELLNCQRLVTVLLYPPTAMQQVELTQLYADVTQRYPYQSFQQLPDGARIANPDGDIFVQGSRLQVQENVAYFQATKEKTLEIIDITRRKFGISQFLTLGVKLIGLLPTDPPASSASFLDENMLPELKEKLELLGPGRLGTGIRVRLQHEGFTDLRIEPFFSELSHIYVELDMQYPFVFSELSSIEQKIDGAYNYLFGEVKSFLASFCN